MTTRFTEGRWSDPVSLSKTFTANCTKLAWWQTKDIVVEVFQWVTCLVFSVSTGKFSALGCIDSVQNQHLNQLAQIDAFCDKSMFKRAIEYSEMNTLTKGQPPNKGHFSGPLLYCRIVSLNGGQNGCSQSVFHCIVVYLPLPLCNML